LNPAVGRFDVSFDVSNRRKLEKAALATWRFKLEPAQSTVSIRWKGGVGHLAEEFWTRRKNGFESLKGWRWPPGGRISNPQEARFRIVETSKRYIFGTRKGPFELLKRRPATVGKPFLRAKKKDSGSFHFEEFHLHFLPQPMNRFQREKKFRVRRWK
jgi:hypothetical protein